MKRWLLTISVVLCALLSAAYGGYWAWREWWSAEQFREAVAEGIETGDFSRAERLKAWGAYMGPWRKEVSGRQLLESVKVGEEKRVEALLILGAKVDAKDATTYDRTPIHWAAYKGSPAIARLLLANGARVDARDNRGITPLHLTTTYGDSSVAILLLANGAQVDARDNYGVTPLKLAVRSLAKITFTF